MWWYDFRFRKRRYRASTKTHSKTLAKEIERAVRRQCEEGSYEIKRVQATRTFGEACQEFLDKRPFDVAPTTVKIAKYNAKHLVSVFANKLIGEIADLDFKKYQQDRLSAGASPRTVNLEFETFRSVLNQAGRWDGMRGKIRKLAENEHIGLAIDPDQECKLISECSASTSRSLASAVTLVLSTGLRCGETRKLQWQMVDLVGANIRVGISKTAQGTNRIIPLNPRSLTCLKEWAAQFPDRRPNHFVFPTERPVAKGKGAHKTTVYINNPLKPMGSWKTAWCKARKRAGLACRFHDLRHTAVTRMLEGGAPYPVVASILGWSSSTMAAMVKRYGHIGQESYKKAVGFLNGPTPVVTRESPDNNTSQEESKITPIAKPRRVKKPGKKIA